MMHRRLLTLFALFTGLAALQAPAQAAAPQAMVAGAEAMARCAEAAQRDSASMAVAAEARTLRLVPLFDTLPVLTRLAPLSVPVILRVDRALE